MSAAVSCRVEGEALAAFLSADGYPDINAVAECGGK